MARSIAFSLPGIGTAAADAAALRNATRDVKGKARQVAQDFEAVFLNSMFQHMFTDVGGGGPLGGGGGGGVWRSFLTDEYAKSFARSGGIGLADHVYRSLLAKQEANDPAGRIDQIRSAGKLYQ